MRDEFEIVEQWVYEAMESDTGTIRLPVHYFGGWPETEADRPYLRALEYAKSRRLLEGYGYVAGIGTLVLTTYFYLNCWRHWEEARQRDRETKETAPR